MDIHILSTGYTQDIHKTWIDESRVLRYNVNVFMNNFREKGIGFLSDSLAEGVERACDARNRGGIRQLLSQGSEGPIHFEIYYKENQNDSPITYELSVAKDRMGRPYVEEERLRQRRAGERNGRPLSFLHLMNGKGDAFEGKMLADVVYPKGIKQFKKDLPTFMEVGKKKSEWAKQIGPYMVPERNILPSFQFFWGALTKRAVS